MINVDAIKHQQTSDEHGTVVLEVQHYFIIFLIVKTNKIIACNAKISEFGNGKQVQVSIHLEIRPVVGPKLNG